MNTSYLLAYAVAAVVGWALLYRLGGRATRRVLTLGAYGRVPAPAVHRPPAALARRALPAAPTGLDRDGMPVGGDFAGPPAVPKPRPVVPVIVRDVMAADGSNAGAENWHGLLAEMTTEEREIYNLEMVLLREEAMTIQRRLFAELDRVIAEFEARLEPMLEAGLRCELKAVDAFEAKLSRSIGCGWETAQYRLVAPSEGRPST